MENSPPNYPSNFLDEFSYHRPGRCSCCLGRIPNRFRDASGQVKVPHHDEFLVLRGIVRTGLDPNERGGRNGNLADHRVIRNFPEALHGGFDSGEREVVGGFWGHRRDGLWPPQLNIWPVLGRQRSEHFLSSDLRC